MKSVKAEITRESAWSPVEGKHLLTHAEVSDSINSFNDWRQRAWRQFSIKMHDKDFPCIFSKSAWGAKSIQFLFCEQRNAGEFCDFLAGMTQYSTFIQTTPLKKRLFSPLVVFFSPEFNAHKTQHETGWEALRWLNSQDSHPWPHNIPVDPESADWSFCFNSVQFFINMSTRDHRILRNRNLGSHLTFVINARENFDSVANGNSPGGRAIRERIRERVRNYNGGVLPKELGFYGEAESLEWKQYQLSEKGVARPQQCPFMTKKEIYRNEGSEDE